MTFQTATDYSNFQFNIEAYLRKKRPKTAPVQPDNDDNALDLTPVLPQPTQAPDNDDALYCLRHFHLGNPTADNKTESTSDDYVPALLNRYRDIPHLSDDYPLFLYPVSEQRHALEPSAVAVPLSRFLTDTLKQVAPNENSARVLRDNLPRVERWLRQTLSGEETPIPAIDLLQRAGEALQNELNLTADHNQRLAQDYAQLLKALPEKSEILGYGRYASIHLLNRVIKARLTGRRAEFNQKIDEHVHDLHQLLTVEQTKSPEALSLTWQADIGWSAYFDTGKLSQYATHHSHGSIRMTKERIERVNKALNVLEAYQQKPHATLLHLVHLGHKPPIPVAEDHLQSSQHDEPCLKASALFDDIARQWAAIFAAVRIAELELRNQYDPALHDPWFAYFNWQVFCNEEMLLLPVIVAFESADRIANNSMTALSHLLSSGRPVQVLVRVQPHNNPYALEQQSPFDSYRLELGYFGISHRQVMVSQTSTARYEHLLHQFASALESPRAGLHLISTGALQQVGDKRHFNAWVIAGAALESRAHPFFCINPDKGDAAAERMNFAGNPQADKDWPEHLFEYKTANGQKAEKSLPFSFADYALIIPRLRPHFRVVPLHVEDDSLMPVTDYLQQTPAECEKKIPFIWAVNSQRCVRRLVVSRALIFSCRDRLNYWHTLQEMAGIHNKYVDRALAEKRAQIQAEEQQAREALSLQYEQQLNEIRNETAHATMQKLTQALLKSSFLTSGAINQTFTPKSAKVEKAKAEKTDTPAESQTTVPSVVETVIEFSDPWIDTPLCTTCNDCININAMMFVYDENKQAMIGDLQQGTFAQMVEAAEICPANCIHPGKPWNADEATPELLERAKGL